MYSIVVFSSLQDEDGQEALSFEFQKIKYSYEINGKKQFLPVAFPVEHPLCYYQNARGYQEDKEIRAAEKKYGTNKWVFQAQICLFRVTGDQGISVCQ